MKAIMIIKIPSKLEKGLAWIICFCGRNSH